MMVYIKKISKYKFVNHRESFNHKLRKKKSCIPEIQYKKILLINETLYYKYKNKSVKEGI